MEEKWRKLLKENNIQNIIIYLKFLCSIRNNLTNNFKLKIIEDVEKLNDENLVGYVYILNN